MKLISAAIFAVVLATVYGQQLPDGGKIWAVLVAGSNTWSNYRHQSDVCHAYQILHKHGVPDEQIIVMMYDDIAQNPLNPTPGVIINHVNGPNVYKDVPIDYSGATLTTDNFIKIITGDEAGMAGIGNGKVLKSGPNDHVFINFVDHGAVGLVAFPYEYMYATQLIPALQKMADNQMFSELTFYLEACEAGSMFVELPSNIHIYAATAANAVESSYACYYSVEYQTYLGDLFSVNWMEDSDANEISTETLTTQFNEVKLLTTESHAMQYGDLSFVSAAVGEFQGESTPTFRGAKPVPKTDAVPAPDVPIHTLKARLAAATSTEDKQKIQKELDDLTAQRTALRKDVISIVAKSVADKKDVKTALHSKMPLVNHACYQQTLDHFSQKCYPLAQNNFAMRHAQVFVNLCEMGVAPSATTAAIDVTCAQPIIGVI